MRKEQLNIKEGKDNFILKENYLIDLNKKLDANKTTIFRSKIKKVTVFSLTGVALLFTILSYHSIVTSTGNNIESNLNKDKISAINKLKNNSLYNVAISVPKNKGLENKNNNFTKNTREIKNSKGSIIVNNILLEKNKYPSRLNKKIKNKKSFENILEIKELEKSKKEGSITINENNFEKNIFNENIILKNFISTFSKSNLLQPLCKDYFSKLNDSVHIANYKSDYLSSKVINFDSRFSIVLLNGINYGAPLVSPKNNSTLDMRNTEKGYFSYTSSIMLSKNISNRYKITLGLQYANYGSDNSFTLVNSSTSGATVFRVYDTIFKFDSTTSTIITTIDSVTNTTASLEQYRNKFSYVEVPLLFGYYKKLNKFEIGIDAGIGFGFLFKKQGYFVDNSDITKEKDKSVQVIYNALISPKITYNLFRNLDIGLQPMFKLNLNSISNSELLNRKFMNYQLNFRIGYYL